MTPSVDWGENWKIRINLNTSIKHEIIKTLLVRLIQERHKGNLNYKYCYSEHPLQTKTQTKKADILFINNKDKEVIAYEIQKELTPTWAEKNAMFYEDWEKQNPWSKIHNYKSDSIVIPLKELSDNIPELIKQLNKYIV